MVNEFKEIRFGGYGSGCPCNDGWTLFQSCCNPRDDHAGQFFVGVKHLDAVSAGGIADKLVDWVGRQSEQPLHDFRHAKIGIIVRNGHEQRHLRGRAKKLPASRVGSFREQHDRFHFRMICSNVDGLIDAATCAAGGDGVSRYSRLGDEVLVGSLDVGGHFIAEDHT